MTIIASPTCTRSGWGERLDDSSDESSDTVDVSSSEKSASSDSESGQSKDLATAVERGNPRKEILLQLRRLHSLERKAKLAIFFTVRGLLNRNMIVFAGRSHSENRSTRELGVDSRNQWRLRLPLMGSVLCSRHKLHPGTVIQSNENSLSSSFQFISHCCFLALLGTAIEASDIEHQPTVWPVPNACAQPYHPGSGSHGQPLRLC